MCKVLRILDYPEKVTDMALEQLQKARMEDSTFSKDECTNCDQDKFRGFYTVLASKPIAGFRGIV